MRTLGFDRPLYIPPFDHRGSFQMKLFGWAGVLSANQTAQIAASEQVIYDGFRAAISSGVPRVCGHVRRAGTRRVRRLRSKHRSSKSNKRLRKESLCKLE